MLTDANVARTRARRAAIALVAVSIFAACGGDGGGGVNTGPPPPPAFAGSYALHSIADSLLPYRVPFPQFDTYIVDSGRMTFNADMSYSNLAIGKVNFTTPATLVDTGTFTKSGSSITFTSKFLHGQTYPGTLSDSSLAVTLVGSLLASTQVSFPMVFFKQH